MKKNQQEATEAISSGLGGNSSSSSSSVSSNNEIVTVTGMDPKFYKAAVKGDTDTFKDKGEEIKLMLTPNKNTILHIHLTSSNVSEAFVVEILQMCPTLLVKANAKGETLLHIAARHGHFNIVKKLIESAKALRSTENTLLRAISTDDKNTALHEAVYFNHIEIVEILTKEDPQISDLANSDGETPLYVATEREYWEVAEKILHNCKRPSQDGPNGRTALHAAVIGNNRVLMVPKLLTRTSVNQADENGWVPLHLAALHKYPDLTEELLKYDRNTAYKRDKKGRTALHFAARYGHVKVMEKIIEYCPDCAELVDENGYNALHYTAVGGKPFAEAARMILDNTSLSKLYNQKDNNGNTPLHRLANTSKLDEDDDHPLLEVRSRVDTLAFNKQNQTALDVAFDHSLQRRASSSEDKSLGYLVKKLRQIGARNSGRITINKSEKKEKHEHDSVAVESTNKKSKEKDTSELSYVDKIRETNMIVAALIATVTFAAGFTMPGGFIQEHDQHDKGSPILKHNPAFQAFVITDTFSFVLSSCAVVFQIFSTIEYNPDMCEIFLVAAWILTMLAMAFMIIAFGTGTYAILGVSKALAVVTLLLALSFFFITIFLFCWLVIKYDPDEEQEEGVSIFPKVDGPILKARAIQSEHLTI